MAVPFPDIDPYEVLGVDAKANPVEIKRAYKKLSLKYHPDKLQNKHTREQEGETSNEDENGLNEMFPKIQFAYSILSDAGKRQRYDSIGSLSEVENGDDEFFNWKEYFDSLTENITIEMIDEDRLKYQNSNEEEVDILQNFIFYEGDFLKLFEVIPHLEFDEEQEQRIFNKIESLIGSQPQMFNKPTIKSFERYKKSRKTKVKNKLKKLAKEAKEAEELEQMINQKHNHNNGNLKSIIQSRQANRLDDLISNLETKYVDKRGKKRQDMNDEEFSKIQQGLLNKKKKKV